MSTEWFVQRKTGVEGPYTAAKLKQLAEQGQIEPSDLIRKGATGNAVPASKVKGLFGEGDRTPVGPSAGSAAPASEESPEWYYGKNGQRSGPITLSQLKRLVETSELLASDLVWREGMAEWKTVQKVKGLIPNVSPPTLPPLRTTEPPPLNAASPVFSSAAPSTPDTPNKSGSGRMAVLVLTVIGGFFSVFVGGCTAAMHEGVANVGKNISNFQNRIGEANEGSRISTEAETIRKQGSKYAMLGLLQAVLGIVGGVYGFRRYDSLVRLTIAGVRIKPLTLAAILILTASILSIHNSVAFITAGVLNGIAGTIALMHARKLDDERQPFSPSQMRRDETAHEEPSPNVADPLQSHEAMSCPPVPGQPGSGNSAVADGFLDTLKRLISPLAARVRNDSKAAAQLTMKQAERGRIAMASLPKAYSELGKAICSANMYRQDFADLYGEINETVTRIKALKADEGNTSGQHFSEAAKRAASKIRDSAAAKALSLKLAGQMRSLGEAAYRKDGESSGPAELTSAIAEHHNRIAQLDAESGLINQSHAGRLITPKRIAIGGLCVVGLISFLLIFSPSRTGKGRSLADQGKRSNAVPRPEPLQGPNGETILVGGDGIGTDWYFHYYVDKEGKRVLHGSSRSSVSGNRMHNTVYDRGVIVSRIESDAQGRKLESYTQVDGNKCQKDEFRYLNDGSFLQLRSLVSIEKTNYGEAITVLRDPEPVMEDGSPSRTGKARSLTDQNSHNVPPNGRKLQVRIATVSKDNRMWWIIKEIDESLQSVECYATAGELIIECDVDTTKWAQALWLFPIQVRLFDENGQHLTHFVTAEGFTVHSSVAGKFNPMYERSVAAGLPDPTFKAKMLETSGNRMLYSLNVRDLRDARIVELGFIERR